MSNIQFQRLENTQILEHGVTRESWFITRKGLFRSLPPCRRELYRMPDGSVVAFRDSSVQMNDPLYIEQSFMDLYATEPEMDVILSDQGVYAVDKIKLYRME